MAVSLSISNSKTSVATSVDAADGDFVAELVWARHACLGSPLLAFLIVPLVHRYLLYVLYLEPVDSSWQFAQAFQSKSALAVAIAVAALPWLWLCGLKIGAKLTQSRFPWAVLFAIGGVLSLSVALSTPRATWFFVEWTKIRTPNPSFARNTLFWEQRNFEEIGNGATNVGLVGSSQTYQGFDLQQLHAECPQFTFEKNTLAGFGPMQYPFLADRLSERGFDIIVCQLSEFDFFREDFVPDNRLRWAASLDGTISVASTLTSDQQWANRGTLAEMTFASVVPLWRQRDHFRRTLFGYWWKKSDPPAASNHDTARLADAPGLEIAITYLKENVGHKSLVAANFKSFELFANRLQQQNVRMIVIEGLVHPQARAAYDTDDLQQKTRQRLITMAAEQNFQYFDQTQLPSFTAADFADAYHLNKTGRIRLSSFLASRLNTAHDNVSR